MSSRTNFTLGLAAFAFGTAACSAPAIQPTPDPESTIRPEAMAGILDPGLPLVTENPTPIDLSNKPLILDFDAYLNNFPAVKAMAKELIDPDKLQCIRDLETAVIQPNENLTDAGLTHFYADSDDNKQCGYSYNQIISIDIAPNLLHTPDEITAAVMLKELVNILAQNAYSQNRTKIIDRGNALGLGQTGFSPEVINDFFVETAALASLPSKLQDALNAAENGKVFGKVLPFTLSIKDMNKVIDDISQPNPEHQMSGETTAFFWYGFLAAGHGSLGGYMQEAKNSGALEVVVSQQFNIILDASTGRFNSFVLPDENGNLRTVTPHFIDDKGELGFEVDEAGMSYTIYPDERWEEFGQEGIGMIRFDPDRYDPYTAGQITDRMKALREDTDQPAYINNGNPNDPTWYLL